MHLRNILLGEDGVGKLCNFSHCVSIPQGETFVKLGFRFVGGNYDYLDNDYLINGVVLEKTDAFGFGTFMQMLYGRPKWRTLENREFPDWLSKSLREGRMDAIVDPKMLEKMGEILEAERCRMEAFVVLSERCTGRRGEVPKMVEVAKELKRFLKTTSSSTETQIRL